MNAPNDRKSSLLKNNFLQEFGRDRMGRLIANLELVCIKQIFPTSYLFSFQKREILILKFI